MNLLLTSVGRRSYLVEYFKQAMAGRGLVHTANSDPLAPALAYGDRAVVTPLIYTPEYIPFLHAYCLRNKIGAVLSLFDADLPVLAANRDIFENDAIRVLVSSAEVIAACNDKYQMQQVLNQIGIAVPKTYRTPAQAAHAAEAGLITYPVMIKPRFGMGSIGIFEAENASDLRVLYEYAVRTVQRTYLKYESAADPENAVLIQEKVAGPEYGLDIINDLSGNYRSTIVKRKITMRAGETDAAETADVPALRRLGRRISEPLHHIGNLDADVILTDAAPMVLDLNARFGGGYPFSHAAGADLPRAMVAWLEGKEADPKLLTAEIGVLSYKDIRIQRRAAAPQNKPHDEPQKGPQKGMET